MLGQFEYTDFIGIVFLSGCKELHKIAFTDFTIDDSEIGNDPPVGIENRVKDQRLQRSLRIAGGGRNAVYDGFQDFINAHACFTARPDDVFRFATDQVDDLFFNLFGHGIVHIHLVHHRDDLQIVFQGQVQIRDGLSLYPLGSIDDQQGSFTSCN